MARCPTPWKPAYPSPQAAYTAATSHPGRRHYRCECGDFHVGTDEDVKHRDMAATSKADQRGAGRKRRSRRRLKALRTRPLPSRRNLFGGTD